ncbi:hypothetical protein [Nibricoccus sp. IMCC34717]|uniref:hypothetical protein n=1 Tax=Nibricoccus sp. IMCC34717 TaxID=3034021 RepID=UPI00384E4EB0
MKWFISLTALVLVVGFVLWQRSGTKVSYVNGLPIYSSLPNREFLFQQDAYILKTKGPQAYPLVAGHAQLPALPETVDAAMIGRTFGDVTVLGTVKTGSRVRIISVRREEGKQGTLISFEVLFHDEAERPYPRLDARLLLDHSPEAAGEPPRFLDGVVVPRVKL